MLWKLNFDVLRTHVNVLFRTSKVKEAFHYGIGNRCKGGLYCVFLDYDQTPEAWVREEICFLQEHFTLGNAYLFQTKRGIHAVFLEKVLLTDLLRILEATSCDNNYRTVPLQNALKVWVLRQSDKKDESIEYLGVMKAFSPLLKSTAHGLYLSQYCSVPRSDVWNGEKQHVWDGSKSIVLGYYKIAEHNN